MGLPLWIISISSYSNLIFNFPGPLYLLRHKRRFVQFFTFWVCIAHLTTKIIQLLYLGFRYLNLNIGSLSRNLHYTHRMQFISVHIFRFTQKCLSTRMPVFREVSYPFNAKLQQHYAFFLCEILHI